MNTANAAAGEILDFTDAIEASGELPPMEVLLRNAVVQAQIGIPFANRDGNFRYCNQEFCSMLGFRVGAV
jgi:PAS domain-containing protein